ncbi:thioredoxin-disulfide reductase [Leuconostoc carnosum]|uniref:Thioredoxin reductase n=2 Tax=Leuconostoc carnosum TaxID=1252 RepID=K0D692_LEUCJ|nr:MULTISPECIES: thioredoxin-disulfide reductase [Leuconostoc]AFT81404.1 thioredoxin-disulfide reductase [Leuconostoc carnosum JB16]KAA8326008.1 thioredoxin-disulfide reductase [Leuconostoc carnosum]KAA8330215.1 thioredoxin-disulfide reductase [Leuconostoc carnosum]KAA8362291.1 thioredoxin-disulfide reductase [Leuconostoc carnosum]KAA8366840.1 thioredoxin-disulfide reductase [Leuconostoc carnosum]
MVEYKQYDVIIIGAGPAGMTAATYASRANLSVLMLDRGIYGGQMNNTAEVENYPGFNSIMGPDLAEKMYASSTQFGAEYGFGTVESIEMAGDLKIVHTDMDHYIAKAIIIGTGSEHIHLGVTGEEDYQGRGVSYCAVCDGAFFRDEDVLVIGGGDSAIEEGLYLTNLAKSVTVLHRRDKLRAQQIIQDRAFANDKINFKWHTEVVGIIGDKEKVTGVTVINNQTQEKSHIDASGIFIYVGLEPNTQVFGNLNITNDEGWIITDEHMQTSIPGIFAIGDVRATELRQITTAVGDGGVAGQGAYDYISQLSVQDTDKVK